MINVIKEQLLIYPYILIHINFGTKSTSHQKAWASDPLWWELWFIDMYRWRPSTVSSNSIVTHTTCEHKESEAHMLLQIIT